MTTTNGKRPSPSRDQIMSSAAYYAAVEGCYDTSEEAQRSNLLTISVVDMAAIPDSPLPAGASHQFMVLINKTAYMVTRSPEGESYEVESHDQTEEHRQERELRDAVLTYAVWHITGEGAGYHPDQGEEARESAIKELLEEGADKREPRDPLAHPVISEIAPDIFLAPGEEGGLTPRVQRQWSVQIGPPFNYCEVGLIGYNDDGTPELVAVDGERDEESDDEDDEEE
jgi:hypothetical protein